MNRSLQSAQNLLEQRVKTEHQEVLVESSPFWPQTITWTLISGSLLGIAWLVLAQTEEVVVATGKLEPIGSVKDVQMPVQGVAKDILVKEGQMVKKGDVLIRLDTEATSSKLKRSEDALRFKEQELALKVNELDRSVALGAREQAMLKNRLDNSTEVMKRYESLAKVGGVGELQALEARTKVEDIVGQISISKVDDRRKQLILQQQIRELKSQIADLRSQIIESQVILRYQLIRSPESGYVYDLKPKSAGFVAQGSEPVLKIVPAGLLQAKVEIPSSKIGFVSVGKLVDVSIDSYPSVDFGVVHGLVKRIGSDAIPPEPAMNKPDYRYPADISLSSQSLRLKDGKQLPLQVGMSLTANIKLRKVSYMQLLLGGLQSKTDSLRKL
ncbi:HlyD family secretion protein [Synechococcus sp. CB0205]|uniref:HlyD family secretion protein n=1 Tax=Synechococcus sp. CB0205 TaxID=232363 RepID=UPI0002002281|nr:HlyD family efflux transporter periplasmic adaptor subunit [Synechococcus sp. CB0205]